MNDMITFITVDFFNHQTQCTSPIEGINPHFDIRFSFKVKTNEFFISHLRND